MLELIKNIVLYIPIVIAILLFIAGIDLVLKGFNTGLFYIFIGIGVLFYYPPIYIFT